MDDRDRAAPVALARDAPVAQPELNLLFAQAFSGEIGSNRINGLIMGHAIVFAGIDAYAVFIVGIPLSPGIGGEGFVCYLDRLPDRKTILPGKSEITFVMRRHGHHRAFAVAHQHVVADPDRHRFAGQRMGDFQAGIHALLFHRRDIRLGHTALLASLDEGGEFGIIPCGPGRQRMFGGDSHEGHSHDGVGTGGVHPQLFILAV